MSRESIRNVRIAAAYVVAWCPAAGPASLAHTTPDSGVTASSGRVRGRYDHPGLASLLLHDAAQRADLWDGTSAGAARFTRDTAHDATGLT